LLKTRRQLQNELIKVQKIDAASVEKIGIRSVYKWEGAGGVYRGLMPAFIYQILMNGVRFAVYEPLRLGLGKEIKRVTGAAEWVQVPCNVVSGAAAGAIGAALGSPFNLMKTRLQSYSPHFATGHQHKYTGMVDAMIKIGQSGEGIRGFYHGVPAAMTRTAVGSAVQLATYDFCKSLATPLGLRQDQIGVHFVAALTSGILVCTAMNPFDVIMTRLFNQSAVKGEKLYTGLIDCATKTIKIEGWRALFKGYIPHYIRIGPHTLLTLMFLEQVRAAVKPFILD
jgi:solute carrier family 25 protein 34/35